MTRYVKWQVQGVTQLPDGVGEDDDYISVDEFVAEEVLSMMGANDADLIMATVEPA